MSTTLLTLTTGTTLEVRGTYDDLHALTKLRTLSEDTGHRELTLVDGERITLHIGMIGLIERARARRTHAIGFR